jgi:hypothetical protein
MTIRVKNTDANKNHLNAIGVFFTVAGRFLEIETSGWHEALIKSGQMSVASYKKNVLGL